MRPPGAEDGAGDGAGDGAAVARLVRRVCLATGVDLSGYRTDGLLRRARGRASLVGADDLDTYLDRLDDEEARRLLEHVLVQVSGWFRDPWVWQSLLDVVLPGVASRGGGPLDLRVWVAGCGEGQEVYTVAACLAAAQQAGHVASWDLLATDVDGTVLAAVEAGRYPVVPLPDVAGPLLGPHLQTGPDGRWQVAATLARRVRTARHDVRDAPPSELGGPADLVVCRNVVMYLDPAVQERVLDGLLASLRPGGVVVLGQSELPLARREAFVPLDVRARAYRSIAVPLALDGPAPGAGASGA